MQNSRQNHKLIEFSRVSVNSVNSFPQTLQTAQIITNIITFTISQIIQSQILQHKPHDQGLRSCFTFSTNFYCFQLEEISTNGFQSPNHRIVSKLRLKIENTKKHEKTTSKIQ